MLTKSSNIHIKIITNIYPKRYFCIHILTLDLSFLYLVHYKNVLVTTKMTLQHTELLGSFFFLGGHKRASDCLELVFQAVVSSLIWMLGTESGSFPNTASAYTH